MHEVEEKKPSAHKIRVEFEMDPEDVRELIEAGSKGPIRLCDEEFEKLIEEGTIKASDYLDEKEMAFATEFIGFKALFKVGSKVGRKVVSKFTDKQSQKVVVAEVVNTVVDGSVSSERKINEDRPKE